MASRAIELTETNPPPVADLSRLNNWMDIAMMALDWASWISGPKPTPVRASRLPKIVRGGVSFFRAQKDDVLTSNANFLPWLGGANSLIIASDGSHSATTESCWGAFAFSSPQDIESFTPLWKHMAVILT